MSKEIINHVCGHTSVMDIYGAIADRARKAAYYGQDICPECQAKARAEKSAADAAAAKAMALPALTGSPKQVAWAESLRAAAIAAAEKNIDAARRRVAAMVREARANYRKGAISVRPTSAFLAQFLAHPSCPIVAAQKTLDALRAETRASWFIDNR